jgi:hypothetical protein
MQCGASKEAAYHNNHTFEPLCAIIRRIDRRLLLDSWGVDLLMAYNPTFVMLSFLKSYFSIASKMSDASRTTQEPKPPESNKSLVH